MQRLAQDLAFAARSLQGTPVGTLTAVLSLAIGIGAATTVYGVADAAFLRPPPFAAHERLAILYFTHEGADRSTRTRWSYPRIQLLRRSVRSFASLSSYSIASLNVSEGGEPESAEAEVVSPEYFATLGVRMAVGRAFAPGDETGGDVVVLGDRLWRRRFAADRAVVGRRVLLNGIPCTVIGVAPAGFRGVSGRGEVWVLSELAPRATFADYLTTGQNFISVVARLRPGVTMDAARAEMAALGAAIQRAIPGEDDGAGHRFSATAVAIDAARVDPAAREGALRLLGAGLVLLLLACANVATLLLGRAAERRRELAVRAALGASRARLLRLLLTESLAIAIAGGLLGALAAAWATEALSVPGQVLTWRNQYGSVGTFASPAIDGRVLAFALTTTLATTLLFGLVPALRGTRVDLTADLKDGARAVSRRAGGGRRAGLQGAAVVMEISLSLLLLVAGGLLLQSYRRIQDQRLGFDPQPIVTFTIVPSEAQYRPQAAPALIEGVLGEIARVPGVAAATVDGCAPLGPRCANSTLYVAGRPVPSPEAAPPVLRHYVGPDHFRVLGVPVLRGRAFTDGDRGGRPRVAVINETAARRFFPTRDPIGERVWFGGGSSFDSPDSAATIVGVVADVPYQPFDDHPIQPDFYTPYLQFTYASRTVMVRAAPEIGDPSALVPALRAAVARAVHGLALFDVQTMSERVEGSHARQRFQARLLGTIAALALLLALSGVYAVMTRAAVARRREVGIRLALGARPVDVVAELARAGGRLAVLGVAIGIVASVATTRVMSSMLYATDPLDPPVLAIVALVVLASAVVASWIPARRAATVDPVETLRSE